MELHRRRLIYVQDSKFNLPLKSKHLSNLIFLLIQDHKLVKKNEICSTILNREPNHLIWKSKKVIEEL